MRCRGWFAALMAAMLLAVAVDSASARRLEVSERGFLAIWTLLGIEVEGTATISCPVTIEGSFHSRSMTKTSGALIGYIDEAKIAGGSTECGRTGRARALSETLPWHLRYDSFTGTLPNITGMRTQIVGAAFAADPEGFIPQCLLRTSSAEPLKAIFEIETGKLRRLRADETSPITLGREFLCEIAGRARFRGSAEVFVDNSTTTRVLIRLVP